MDKHERGTHYGFDFQNIYLEIFIDDVDIFHDREDDGSYNPAIDIRKYHVTITTEDGVEFPVDLAGMTFKKNVKARSAIRGFVDDIADDIYEYECEKDREGRD